jgi:phosphatidylglycerophosphate synthase
MASQSVTRRPLKSRETKWAIVTARWLTRRGVKPNQVSILSVVFSGLAGGCLLMAGTRGPALRAAYLVAAAACIQLRLLCNLFDGMIAVEGGLKTKSGEIFNDLPDRIADSLILVLAGYSVPNPGWASTLGWAAGLLAVMTAYVRLLGDSAGVAQYFLGPMAKQQRMAVMTLACLLAALEPVLGWDGRVMTLALAVIVVGCAVTIVRRTRRIVRELESR